jgi:hypothetical protein
MAAKPSLLFLENLFTLRLFKFEVRWRRAWVHILGGLIALGLLASGCKPGPAPTPSPPLVTRTSATAAISPSAPASPSTSPSPTLPAPPSLTASIPSTSTATPAPMAAFGLERGDLYFNLDGKQSFVLSRNLTGKSQDDFNTLLEWAHLGGAQVIRVHLTHGWWGDPWINPDWSVNEKWAQDWDGLFDQAQNDGYSIYSIEDRDDAIEFMKDYALAELPIAKFVEEIDFSGFKPLASTPSSAAWGAAIGNEDSVIGWYRDASCEPPAWDLKPLISKQTVSLAIPGPGGTWQVDFYDAKTGVDVIGSTIVVQEDDQVTIELPDFTDDIVFRMQRQE